MNRRIHRATLARVAMRVGLGVTMTAGVVALGVPVSPVTMVLAVGAGGLVALSSLGDKRRSRARATAPHRP